MKDEFVLRDFTPGDFSSAAEIARQAWGDEEGFLPHGLLSRIYNYLVRYYYVPDSPFSLAVTHQGDLCAFLLAAPGEHESSAADRWIEELLSEREREIFESYKAYLEGNSHATEKEKLPDEVMLLLFAGIKKGSGSLLMAEFERRCRENNIKSMLLWTDDTCDFQWYQRRNFTEVAVFPANPSLPGRNLTTLIFRKEIPR